MVHPTEDPTKNERINCFKIVIIHPFSWNVFVCPKRSSIPGRFSSLYLMHHCHRCPIHCPWLSLLLDPSRAGANRVLGSALEGLKPCRVSCNITLQCTVQYVLHSKKSCPLLYSAVAPRRIWGAHVTPCNAHSHSTVQQYTVYSTVPPTILNWLLVFSLLSSTVQYRTVHYGTVQYTV